MVTDARVLEAVTRLVLDLGAKPVIGEGAAAGYDFMGASSTEEAFRVSGTRAVADKLGVALYNLNKDDSICGCLLQRTTGRNGFVPGCLPNEEQLLRHLGSICGFDAEQVLARRKTERKKLWEQTRDLLNT